MLEKEEIILYLKENYEILAKDYEVSKIGLFGSYANNIQTEESDIDIVVDMPSKYRKFFALKNMLESKFHKKVDLVIMKNLRLLIKKRIEKEIIYVN